MPNQIVSSVENNFTKGLITESTGLNFPENAATDCDNCIFTLVGDVTRREGFALENNGTYLNKIKAGKAMSTYVWSNPGGDGDSRLIVKQIGDTLYFWNAADVTESLPLSQNYVSSVNIAQYVVFSQPFGFDKECQFADGNGFLFVFHQDCDPFYVTYNPVTTAFTSAPINIQIRDFAGTLEPGIAVNQRPSNLTIAHQYNLQNQGWTSGNTWGATSGTNVIVGTGLKTFFIGTVAGVTVGQNVNIALNINQPPDQTPWFSYGVIMAGIITNYAGGNVTISVSSTSGTFDGGAYGATVGHQYPPYTYTWIINPINTGYINTFQTATGTYPSNADVWWYFKNASGVFDPATTLNNISLGSGRAPQGHYLLNAFTQSRSSVSSVAGLQDITTVKRPSTGCWFQGRVWFSGVNSSQASSGTANYFTWTNQIYFSQIIQDPSEFGYCYQVNDPTSENLFDILPTDGGVIVIAKAGVIHKLFPVANGLLVFADNGIWFITGSQGIGFSANDYTLTQISEIKIQSHTSFVNVNGLPMFWNEEGIYEVTVGQSGQFKIEPITVGTILSFFNEIPQISRKYARGAYHPIDYVVQWVFRSTAETTVTDRYEYDRILCFNTVNKAFYPYTIASTPIDHKINDVFYLSCPGDSSVDPVFKYPFTISDTNTLHSFAEEGTSDFMDWGLTNFDSYFVTGYKLHGKGQFRFQIPYIYVFSRADGTHRGYFIQGMWDYATDPNSGRWTQKEIADINDPKYGMLFRRHRIRGRGLVLQYRVTSRDGLPFDIMGWSTYENINSGV